MRKLTCQEVLDQLWEYLDEDARAELCAEIEGHLTGCCHCRVEVDSIRKTVLLFRAGDETCTPIQLSERLRTALDVAYREHGADD
ncbi:MAG: zf-HC2 domain-containing protein [Candidatus Eisenbacteria bacterium]